MQADGKKNTKNTKTDADGQSSNSLTLRCKIKRKIKPTELHNCSSFSTTSIFQSPDFHMSAVCLPKPLIAHVLMDSNSFVLFPTDWALLSLSLCDVIIFFPDHILCFFSQALRRTHTRLIQLSHSMGECFLTRKIARNARCVESRELFVSLLTCDRGICLMWLQQRCPSPNTGFPHAVRSNWTFVFLIFHAFSKLSHSLFEINVTDKYKDFTWS